MDSKLKTAFGTLLSLSAFLAIAFGSSSQAASPIAIEKSSLMVTANTVPTPKATPTNKPTPKATPTNKPTPTAIPANVKKALLRYPHIRKLVNVNKIVVIYGEYCMGGKLMLICFNNKTKTYTVGSDFDTSRWFGPSK